VSCFRSSTQLSQTVTDGNRIPFERALDFANKEKITELLYPLFVHNIGGLLYNPENASRTSAVLAATEQRRINGATTQGGQRPAQVSQPPALHHHHSMQSAIGSHGTPTAHSIAPHPGAGRPGLDRAHTFPTPPTSASSVMGMGNQGSSYEWGGQNIANNVAAAQPLSIDTGLSNARSMPNTPVSTPPGSSIQNMQPYPGQQSYDTPKQYYSAPPSQQGAYAQQNMNRYGQPITSNGYSKNDMGPPSAPGSGNPEVDHHDIKTDPYGHSNSNGAAGHGTTGAEPDHHHHDSSYMSGNASAYGSNRAQYAYNHPTTSIQGEHPHMSPELSGSPSQQAGSGRGTPRTATGTQPQWAPGYQTPPRPSNLYNVVSDSRTSNSTSAAENYNTSGYSNASMNGTGTSAKRAREDDDQDPSGRPNSRGIEPGYDIKRRKTVRQDTLGAPMGAMPNMQGIKSGGGAVRQR
jgi:enhanced filamentous growth protein 1